MKSRWLLIPALLIIGCSSQKGWTEKNVQAYVQSCIEDNTASIGEEKVKSYCECMQKRVQEAYPDYPDADKLTMSQNLDISNACTPKGWSEDEKEVFMNSCTETRQQMGDNQTQSTEYCDCMMQKLQTRYPDILKTESIPQEEMRTLAGECMAQRIVPKR